MHCSADYNQNLPISRSLCTLWLTYVPGFKSEEQSEAGLQMKGTMGNILTNDHTPDADLRGDAGLWSHAVAPQAECTPASAAAAPPPLPLPPAEPCARGPAWFADPPDAPAAAESPSAQKQKHHTHRQACT